MLLTDNQIVMDAYDGIEINREFLEQKQEPCEPYKQKQKIVDKPKQQLELF